MSAIASQITSLTIVYWRRRWKKTQSPALLAFVRGIHRWPVNSPHKGPVTRKMFPLDDVIMPSVTKMESNRAPAFWTKSRASGLSNYSAMPKSQINCISERGTRHIKTSVHYSSVNRSIFNVFSSNNKSHQSSTFPVISTEPSRPVTFHSGVPYLKAIMTNPMIPTAKG